MLEVKELRLVYPNGYEALRSIDLNVGGGEIVGIVGRSGAGKSTLLRCINGLERPTSGSVVLDGQDVASLEPDALRAVRARVGFIWQEYNLVDRLSVMNNVLSGRLAQTRGPSPLVFYFNREHRQIAVRSLERLNMLHRARQRADRLSGGEKQRVAIARALAQQPRIILADEPVASLDPELSVQVLKDLARVSRDEGVPTLINLHAIDLARAFCDRVVGIARGTVVFDGPVSALDEPAMDRIYRFDQAPSRVPEVFERELAGTAV